MSIALSWSRVSDWKQCPRKFYLKYVAKQFPQEDASKSVHLVKGAEMHKQLENYVYDKLNAKSQEGRFYSPSVRETLPMVDRMMANFGQVWPERQVAVTYDFKPAEWFGKDVAWRAIWDFSGINQKARHALIVDWKTGKVTDYDKGEPGQLHLSAALAIPLYDVDKVDVFYAFIEHKVKKPDTPLTVTRDDDYPHIRGFFNAIYDKVNVEKDWAPTANQYCNYCPAVKTQCQFSCKL